MADYIQNFLEAIGMVTDNAISHTNYATTVTGTIKKVSENTKGAYTVVINSKEIAVTGAEGYEVGDIVSILVINNDPEKAQYIVGLETAANADTLKTELTNYSAREEEKTTLVNGSATVRSAEIGWAHAIKVSADFTIKPTTDSFYKNIDDALTTNSYELTVQNSTGIWLGAITIDNINGFPFEMTNAHQEIMITAPIIQDGNGTFVDPELKITLENEFLDLSIEVNNIKITPYQKITLPNAEPREVKQRYILYRLDQGIEDENTLKPSDPGDPDNPLSIPNGFPQRPTNGSDPYADMSNEAEAERKWNNWSRNGWTSTAPAPESDFPFLWKYTVIRYTDELGVAEGPEMIGSLGRDGLPGYPGSDGFGYTMQLSQDSDTVLVDKRTGRPRGGEVEEAKTEVQVYKNDEPVDCDIVIPEDAEEFFTLDQVNKTVAWKIKDTDTFLDGSSYSCPITVTITSENNNIVTLEKVFTVYIESDFEHEYMLGVPIVVNLDNEKPIIHYEIHKDVKGHLTDDGTFRVTLKAVKESGTEEIVSEIQFPISDENGQLVYWQDWEVPKIYQIAENGHKVDKNYIKYRLKLEQYLGENENPQWYIWDEEEVGVVHNGITYDLIVTPTCIHYALDAPLRNLQIQVLRRAGLTVTDISKNCVVDYYDDTGDEEGSWSLPLIYKDGEGYTLSYAPMGADDGADLMTENLISLMIRATINENNEQIIETIPVVQDGFNGSDGQTAQDFNVTASSYVITKNAQGAATNLPITLTAHAMNLGSGLTYTWERLNNENNSWGGLQSDTINTFTIDGDNLEGTYRCHVLNHAWTDTVTIGETQDGSSAISVTLSNPVVTFNQNAANEQETCSVLVYEGGQALIYSAENDPDNQPNSSYHISELSMGEVNEASGVITIADQDSSDHSNFTVTVKSSKGEITTHNLSIAIKVVKDGERGYTPPQLSLSNDTDVIAISPLGGGQPVGGYPSITARGTWDRNEYLMGSGEHVFTWTTVGCSGVVSGDPEVSIRSIEQTYNLSSLSAASGSVTCSWYYKTQVGHEAESEKLGEKTFTFTTTNSNVDYNLYVDQTVYNITYGSPAELEVYVTKWDNTGVQTLAASNFDEIVVQYLKYSSLNDALENMNGQWTALEYGWKVPEPFKFGKPCQLRLISNTEEETPFVWDYEIIEFVQDGQNKIEQEISVYKATGTSSAPTSERPVNGAYPSGDNNTNGWTNKPPAYDTSKPYVWRCDATRTMIGGSLDSMTDWSEPYLYSVYGNEKDIDLVNTFNALTNNGAMQGLFYAPKPKKSITIEGTTYEAGSEIPAEKLSSLTTKDRENLDVYLNAEFIKTGALVVEDEENGTVFSANLSEGEVYMAGWQVTTSDLRGEAGGSTTILRKPVYATTRILECGQTDNSNFYIQNNGTLVSTGLTPGNQINKVEITNGYIRAGQELMIGAPYMELAAAGLSGWEPANTEDTAACRIALKASMLRIEYNVQESGPLAEIHADGVWNNASWDLSWGDTGTKIPGNSGNNIATFYALSGNIDLSRCYVIGAKSTATGALPNKSRIYTLADFVGHMDNIVNLLYDNNILKE